MIRRPRPRARGSSARMLQEHVRLRLVHPGRRLVEQQEGRIGGERPRDLDAALVAVAQAGAQIVGAPRQAEFGEQRVGLAAGRAQAVAVRERRGLDVLADGQVVEQPHDLERSARCPRSAMSRGGRPDKLARRQAAMRPPASRTWPVIALTSVVLPEPFGPIRPRISAGASDSETRSSARSPGTRPRPRRRRASAGHRLSRRMPAPAVAAPRQVSPQGAGSLSGRRQPRNVALPPFSSTITAALSGTWPSSAVP